MLQWLFHIQACLETSSLERVWKSVSVLQRPLDSCSSAMVSTNIELSIFLILIGSIDQGVMSGIITEPIFLGTFPKMASDYKLGSIQALVVAIYEIGCLIGSFFIIGYGDKLGRRRAVLVGTLIMLVGTAIQASSTTLAQLIVGRYIAHIHMILTSAEQKIAWSRVPGTE